MSIQPIRYFGDPVLTTPASAVTTFDKELRNLVADLVETMQGAPGAGLAAPQIGVSLRVFVWDVDDVVGHLINPSLDLSSENARWRGRLPLFPRTSLQHTPSTSSCRQRF